MQIVVEGHATAAISLSREPAGSAAVCLTQTFDTQRSTRLTLTPALFVSSPTRVRGDGRGDEPVPCNCTRFLGHNITLPWSSGSSGFLGIQADRAEVQWVGPGSPPSELSDGLVLLGDSDGSIVFFDFSEHRAVVVASANVVVSVQGNLVGWDENQALPLRVIP